MKGQNVTRDWGKAKTMQRIIAMSFPNPEKAGFGSYFQKTRKKFFKGWPLIKHREKKIKIAFHLNWHIIKPSPFQICK